MGAYRFHTELSSDEVWFRMNQLLMSFAAWEPERYQITGQLTAWGCYLRLTRAGDRPGTRVPLWLWTEAAEKGCDICCRFLPRRSRLRSMAAEPSAFALWFLCVSMQSGSSVTGALVPALLIGGIFALFMVMSLWLVPRLISWRWERRLLGWLEVYVLPQDLGSVLLPDLETQRENWEGLPADQETGGRYVFHSPLPPETLRETLEGWRQEENRRVGPQAQLALSWKDWQATIKRRDYRHGRDAVPFRGRLESDGAGGSVLRGGFYPSPLKIGLWAAAMLLSVGTLAWFILAKTPHPTASFLLVYLVRGGAQDLLVCENKDSWEILKFLRIYFIEIEE